MSARSNSDGFKTVRKSDLINMLREKGLSKRKAASGLNWVLYCMKRALWRGENVDLPIGSIHAKSSPAGRKRRWQRFRNIQSGEVFFRIVHPPKRMIVFTVDKRMILRGLDALPPIPPERQRKYEELERLYLQLMGREITLPDLKLLLNAVVDSNKPDLKHLLNAGVDSNKPEIDPNRRENIDRLVARLRYIVKDQRTFTDLPSEVWKLYGIG